MAIYRPQRRRWTVAAGAAAAGLLVGLLVGWGLLRPGPDPVGAIEEVRSALLQAAGTLEVVEIEYAESVEDGSVIASPEYEGARDALASSREQYDEVGEAVAAISPDAASAIDDAYAELERAVSDLAPPEEVSARVEELREMLTGALGD